MTPLMKKRVRTSEASRTKLRRTARTRIVQGALGMKGKNGTDGNGSSGGFKRFIMQLVVLTTIALLITASYHLSLSHPFFNIQTVKISGNETVVNRELEDDKANIMGANIFTADLAGVREGLLKNPWIESVSIERRFPSSLYVTIGERKPAAEAVVSGRRYYIDSDGLVLGYGENYKRETDFLAIIGFDKTVKPGEHLEEARVLGAYELQGLFELEIAFSDRASVIDVRVADRLRVITDSGVSISFGPEREKWREKFLEYIAVRKILSERGERAESIDLSFKDQVVVSRIEIVVQSEDKKADATDLEKLITKKADRG